MPTASGRSKPVISELARAAGVSPTTVSHVFNKPERVAPATRERVLKAAAEMGYTGPNPTARQLRRGRADAIGVIYTDELGFAFEDPATASILGGLSRVCGAHDLNLLLVPLGPSASGVRSAALASAGVDGFVVYSVPEQAPGLDLVLQRGLPTVIIDSPQNIPTAAFVGLDDRGATKALAEHLLQLGHRRIGIIASRLGTSRYNGTAGPERWREAPYVIIANRIRGIHDALAGFPGEAPIEERFDNTIESGTQALHDLLDRHPDLTAVCCLTDVLALGALTAASQRGLAVPDDLTITGWDDLPEARRVGLTTIGQPLAGKGQTAGELLLAGESTATPRRVILPTSVEIRRTSAPPPRGR
jgi:DNA-binding LacI/PurR family transcriptional regulator